MAGGEINDGLHLAHEHSDLVRALLDTPEVQRTEFINQTGMAFKAFPSIRYPRKTHLIGVAALAPKAYQAILKNSSVHLPGAFKSLLEVIMITHDIGHCPFSHGLEKVVDKKTGKSHEQISAEIVRGDLSFVEYFSERPHLLGKPEFVAQALEKYKALDTIPQILEHFGVDPNLVVRALCPEIGGELSDQNLFLKELIDGSLWDIDKGDYLPRDARAANIPEGLIEPSRLLNGLSVVEFGEARRVALPDSMLPVLCQWVAARKFMYLTVYHHKTGVKYEAMLGEAVKTSMDDFAEDGIEIHLLTDAQLLSLLTQYNPVSAELALDVQYGRHFKYCESFTILSKEVDERDGGNEAYHQLQAVNVFAKKAEEEGADFPLDVLRDAIVAEANSGVGEKIQDHEVIAYSPTKFKTADQWKQKLDMLIYAHKDPSIVCTLPDMVDGTAELTDTRAQDIFYELCKPQSRTYFVVYAAPQHKERVERATEKVIQELM